MIVWSRGLGKLRLPMALEEATLVVKGDCLAMEGVIEPVCWQYSLKLKPNDLCDFLRLMADRRTTEFLAESRGILLPFVARLILAMPRLAASIAYEQTIGRMVVRKPS